MSRPHFNCVSVYQHLTVDLVRQTSLTTAEAVVGTCPDMCPEKERYMREDRRRLSWFELHPDSEQGVSRDCCLGFAGK